MSQLENLDREEMSDKGQENGSCNRTACQAPGARWYNHGSHAWYCGRCRRMIEFDAVNYRNWKRDHEPNCGHPMFETREMFEERGVTEVHTMAPRPRKNVKAPRRLRKDGRKALFRA